MFMFSFPIIKAMFINKIFLFYYKNNTVTFLKFKFKHKV